MKKVNYYSASEYVARRAGCTNSNYRIAGGRYILSENDVRAMLPFITPEELITGLDIILVSRDEAERLIKEGGYKIGVGEPEEPSAESVVETEPTESPSETETSAEKESEDAEETETEETEETTEKEEEE